MDFYPQFSRHFGYLHSTTAHANLPLFLLLHKYLWKFLTSEPTANSFSDYAKICGFVVLLPIFVVLLAPRKIGNHFFYTIHQLRNSSTKSRLTCSCVPKNLSRDRIEIYHFWIMPFLSWKRNTAVSIHRCFIIMCKISGILWSLLQCIMQETYKAYAYSIPFERA